MEGTTIFSLLSLIFALIFGLSGFLMNVLGRVPALNRRRSISHKEDETKLFIQNNGTGPAVLTRLTVVYHDWTNEIEIRQDVDGVATWFDDMWERIKSAETEKGIRRAAKSASQPDCAPRTYYMNHVIIAASGELVILAGNPPTDEKEYESFKLFFRRLDLVIDYKSMNGMRYTTSRPYHPAGNLGGRSYLFSFYLVIARALGIFKWN